MPIRKTARLLKKRVIFKYKNFSSSPRHIAQNDFIPTQLLLPQRIKFGCRYKKGIIKNADAICNHSFNIFNSRINFGNEINWHLDFKSGRIWDKGYYGILRYENIYDNSDVKVAWELNRFLHFLDLAFAYSLTKNEKYAKEFSIQILDWKRENPVPYGINWLVSMEAAIRAVNWMAVYPFFKHSPSLSREFWKDYFKLLYAHGNYIFSNPEWTIANENHYLSDLLGLLSLGIFFDNKKWKQFAVNELEKEIINQVKEGVHYEASINYHRLACEIFLLAYIFCFNNGISLSEAYKLQLEKMLEFILHYTKPNSKAPSIGDSDESRILDIWNKNPLVHNELPAIGAVIFKRGDFKGHGRWNGKLPVSKEQYNKIKLNRCKLSSKGFNGYYIMRNENCYLIIHCGDIGREGYGGHGHNDILSFELNMDKTDLIMDPGTYAYTANTKARNLFRSTAYHNTLALQGREQNEISWKTPFKMINKSKAVCLRFETSKSADLFSGEHYGFSPLIHRREIRFGKNKEQFEIKDYLFSENGSIPRSLLRTIFWSKNLFLMPHSLLRGFLLDKNNKPANCPPSLQPRLYLHLAPNLKIEQKKNKIILNNKYIIAVSGYSVKDGFVSKRYGSETQAKIIEYPFITNPMIIRIYRK
ncbi:alginate lyase family protein [archaeon]|nr:alginate lyase family protein [archaeon]